MQQSLRVTHDTGLQTTTRRGAKTTMNAPIVTFIRCVHFRMSPLPWQKRKPPRASGGARNAETRSRRFSDRKATESGCVREIGFLTTHCPRITPTPPKAAEPMELSSLNLSIPADGQALPCPSPRVSQKHGPRASKEGRGTSLKTMQLHRSKRHYHLAEKQLLKGRCTYQVLNHKNQRIEAPAPSVSRSRTYHVTHKAHKAIRATSNLSFDASCHKKCQKTRQDNE